MARGSSRGDGRSLLPFLAGLLAGAAGTVLAQSLSSRRGLDPRLVKGSREDKDLSPVVLVPGILGSGLVRPGGTQVWLNLGNAFGSHDLSLPIKLPLSESRDDLQPGGLLGVDAVLPRLFGFTEYADFVSLLQAAGFRRDGRGGAPAHHVFTYDWRRDLVETVKRLDETLEALAEARGDGEARFNLIGHSMGGLVARYYLRYGTAEPEEGAPVTWAGARRIRNLVLVAVPNGGSVPAIDAILNGSPVGLSTTTLAASVIARMPAIYQLLPAPGTGALLDHRLEPLDADLHDVATWERLGWGPFTKGRARSTDDRGPDREAQRAFVAAVLSQTRAFHRALSVLPGTPCPTRVVMLGGDCLPTLGRALVPERPGSAPRFVPWTRREAGAMFEAGDGRVTRASALASHLPGADETESGCGLPEVSQALFGGADHHGIYSEPTFQSILLRLLLRPERRMVSPTRPIPLP